MLLLLVTFLLYSSSLAAIPTIVIAYDQPTQTDASPTQKIPSIIKEIKQQLTKNGDFRVHVVSKKEDTNNSYQAVSLANRLQADLFIMLSIKTHKIVKPVISTYYRTLDPLNNKSSFHAHYDLLSIDQAHTRCLTQTHTIAQQCYALLNSPKYKKTITAHAPLGLPIKPLEGLIIPGILLEVEMHQQTHTTAITKPIVETITALQYQH